MTAASLEDVRVCGSVKSHPAQPGSGWALRERTRRGGAEVNYREQAGCAAAAREAASQQLFALLHLPESETIFCGSRDL